MANEDDVKAAQEKADEAAANVEGVKAEVQDEKAKEAEEKTN